MRVLVTGGCGFVGRHFVTRLIDEGHNVLVVDDLSTGLAREQWVFKPKELNGFHHCIGDLRKWFDYEHSASINTKERPDDFDLVIHCAAIVGGRLNIDGDPLAVATNLSIDAELFNWIVRAEKKPKLIYFSSSAVYPLELQTKERNCDLSELLTTFDTMRIGRPDATYGWSKMSGEYLAKVAAEKYGLDVKIYRPFGGYGEDQAMTYPFPSIIRRVLQGENPVTVWGSGDQERDFIHIDDVVEGVLSTYEKLKPGEVLNLGTGRGVSFKELARLACEILKRPARIVNDATKPEGVFRRVADTLKLDDFYKPKVWLEQGILRVGQHLEKTLDAAKKAV